MPALLIFIIRIFRAIREGLKEPEFRGLFTSVILLVVTGAIFYHNQEGWSWLDSVYFTIITLTTVGYGDLSPETAVGKIFTIIYIIIGLGILSSFIVLLAGFQQQSGGGLLGNLRHRDKQEEGEE